MVALFFQKTFLNSALATVLVDQVSKYFIHFFAPYWSFLFISVHPVRNTGAGFGILQGQTLWLAVLSLAVALAVVFSYQKLPKQPLPQMLWGLFLGGVLGNFIDRAFRGFVLDFIDFGFWPAFNVADAALSISVIGLVVYYWKRK